MIVRKWVWMSCESCPMWWPVVGLGDGEWWVCVVIGDIGGRRSAGAPMSFSSWAATFGAVGFDLVGVGLGCWCLNRLVVIV